MSTLAFRFYQPARTCVSYSEMLLREGNPSENTFAFTEFVVRTTPYTFVSAFVSHQFNLPH